MVLPPDPALVLEPVLALELALVLALVLELAVELVPYHHSQQVTAIRQVSLLLQTAHIFS